MQTKPVNVVRFSDDISPKKTPLDVKLDLTKDLLIREHWAYLGGDLFYALDMHGVLAHEVLAIDSYLREGSMIFVFDGERWEKKLLVENVSIVNCAVDSKSNLYFMAEQEIDYKRVICVGCIDMEGQLSWHVWCNWIESIYEVNTSLHESLKGQFLLDDDARLVFLTLLKDEKGAGAKLRVLDLEGNELWTYRVDDIGDGMNSYFLTVYDGSIEVLHGNCLEQWSREGAYLGKIVFDETIMVEDIWRYDQKIIVDATKGKWDLEHYIVQGGGMFEFYRETGEVKELNKANRFGKGSFYYAEKYFSDSFFRENEKGERVSDLSVGQEPEKEITKVEIVSSLAACPVMDDFGQLYLLSDVAFPSRKRREVQRILLLPTGEIIKNDVYKVEEKELLEITKLLKHNGKLYIFSLWECNKKERAIHEEKARLGELPGRLLPIEELDVYDIGKVTSTMKTKLTIIEAK